MNASLALILEHEAKRKGGGAGGGSPKIRLSKGSGSSQAINNRARGTGQTYRAGRKGKVWGQRPGRTVSTHGGFYHAVAKSKYVMTGKKAKTILGRALDYYQNRERADFEEERKYFTKDRDELDRTDIRQEIESRFGEKIAYHTMILSSGDNSIDGKQFTREVMQDLEERLGYEIDYWAVEHYNTDHYHTHLIIAGKAGNGDRDVRFDRPALNELREIGNEYLGRERMLDRELDREVDRELLFGAREYDLALERDFRAEIAPLSRQELEELGLSSNQQARQEMKELGLGGIYDLGKPFENIPTQEKELVAGLLDGRDRDLPLEEQLNSPANWDREVVEDAFEVSMQDIDYAESERISSGYNEKDRDVDQDGESKRSGNRESDKADERERDDDEY